jgi:hypothetical protein
MKVLLSGHEPGVFHPHASLLVPAVISAVSDPFYKISKSIWLIIFISICFSIKVLLSGHEPGVFHPHASLLVPAVISAVSDPFYKISSEALLVLQLLVKVPVV